MWLSDWAYRIPISISAVGSDLTDFPIAIKLSTASGIGDVDVSHVFDILGTNSKKIAITRANGETQCYAEIEKWDSGNEIAVIHVKIPSVYSVAPTQIYLYYDATKADNTTYISDPGSSSAWDSNYVGVWNLQEDPSGTAPQIIDSTGNQDGTTAGTMTSGDLVNTDMGYGLDFDGSDDEIDLTGWTLTGNAATFSFILKSTVASTTRYMLDANAARFILAWNCDTTGTLGCYTGGSWKEFGLAPNDGAYHQIDFIFNNTSLKCYVDNVLSGVEKTITAIDLSGLTDVAIGSHYTAAGLGHFASVIDSIRVSDSARSTDYLNAQKNSFFDNLLTFGVYRKYPYTDTFIGINGIEYQGDLIGINEIYPYQADLIAINALEFGADLISKLGIEYDGDLIGKNSFEYQGNLVGANSLNGIYTGDFISINSLLSGYTGNLIAKNDIISVIEFNGNLIVINNILDAVVSVISPSDGNVKGKSGLNYSKYYFDGNHS